MHLRTWGVLVPLGFAVFLTTFIAAQSRPHPNEHVAPAALKTKPATQKPFPCSNPKPQSHGSVPGKHPVTLSWKASVSLSIPPASGDGYNLYRLNPDGSCTKLNTEPIRTTVYEDRYVKLGQSYRYVAKAIKRNSESIASGVVEVTIPSK
jgi:hypothetical protein